MISASSTVSLLIKDDSVVDGPEAVGAGGVGMHNSSAILLTPSKTDSDTLGFLAGVQKKSSAH